MKAEELDRYVRLVATHAAMKGSGMGSVVMVCECDLCKHANKMIQREMKRRGVRRGRKV